MYNGRQQPEDLYARQVLDATERAMARAAAIAHEDLKRGLNTLAMITCAAPLVGILGTLFGLLFDTFLGFDGEKSTGMALIAGRISRACVPSAFGILIGIHALWAYRYLRGRLADFDGEMETTSLGLINSLVPHLDRLRSRAPIQELSDSLPYLAAYSPDLDAHRKYRLFTTLTTVGLLLLPWSMQVALRLRSVEFDAMPLSDLILASLWSPHYDVLLLVPCRLRGVGGPFASKASWRCADRGCARPCLARCWIDVPSSEGLVSCGRSRRNGV
jgi:hypothetical protein